MGDYEDLMLWRSLDRVEWQNKWYFQSLRTKWNSMEFAISVWSQHQKLFNLFFPCPQNSFKIYFNNYENLRSCTIYWSLRITFILSWSLDIIQYWTFTNPITQLIHIVLRTLFTIQSSVIFIWIPGHIGHPQHDRVDQAAQEATRFPKSRTLLPLYYTILKPSTVTESWPPGITSGKTSTTINAEWWNISRTLVFSYQKFPSSRSNTRQTQNRSHLAHALLPPPGSSRPFLASLL